MGGFTTLFFGFTTKLKGNTFNFIVENNKYKKTEMHAE